MSASVRSAIPPPEEEAGRSPEWLEVADQRIRDNVGSTYAQSWAKKKSNRLRELACRQDSRNLGLLLLQNSLKTHILSKLNLKLSKIDLTS